MEPVSIAANAAGLITLAASVITNVGRYCVNVSTANEKIRGLKDSIENLKDVMLQIQNVFDDTPRPNQFEVKHWRHIKKLIDACNQSLHSADQLLPDPNSTRPADTLRLAWRNDLLAAHRDNIAAYTECLQFSITLLNYKNQRWTQEQIKSLKDEIRKTDRFSRNQDDGPRTNGAEVSTENPSQNVLHEEMVASRNIDGWRGAVETLAFGISFYDSKSMITNTNGAVLPQTELEKDRVDDVNDISELLGLDDQHTGSPSEMSNPDDDSEAVESDAESEVGIENLNTTTRPEYLDLTIEKQRRNVERAIGAALYKSAEGNLKQLIASLEEKYGETFKERNDLEQQLAGIYYKQKSLEGFRKAKRLLKDLANKTSQEKESHYNATYLLALIYWDEGQLNNALGVAKHTLDGRINLAADEDARKKANLLVAKIYDRKGDFASAQVHKEYAQSNKSSRSNSSDSNNDNNSSNSNSSRSNRSNSSNSSSSSNSSNTENGQVESQANPGDKAVNWLKWLHDNGFDVDKITVSKKGGPLNQPHPENQERPIQLAIKLEATDVLLALLNEGAYAEFQDEHGATPLLQAATTTNKALVSALLDAGVDASATDSHGNTALHRVPNSQKDGTDTATLLLQHSPAGYINQKNNYGETPLFRAAQFGDLRMVNLLLAQKPPAQVNEQEKVGNTPLYIAIENRRDEAVIEALLKAGADYELKNVNDEDAMQLVERLRPKMEGIKNILEARRQADSRGQGGEE